MLQCVALLEGAGVDTRKMGPTQIRSKACVMDWYLWRQSWWIGKEVIATLGSAVKVKH